MNDRTAYFLIAVGIFLTSLIGTAGHYYRRAQKSSQGDWESLLKRLIFVDRNSIAEVALDVIDESGQQRKDEDSAVLESSQIWELIDGWEGLEALEANCAVLIDLAFYVQQWYPEALAVTEDLRLNAREIEWHVGRLKSAAQTGKLENSILMNAQRAAVTYYLMTRRLLALYEHGNLPMLADLQKAL